MRALPDGGGTNISGSFVVRRTDGALTAPTLVSNTGQAQDGSHFRVGKDGTSTWRTAQLFTTGGHAAGYSLAAVDVKISSDNTGGNRDETKLKVSIYNTSGSNPGTSRYVLTNPAITLDALNTFVAPANATLDANTTYAVFLESTSANHHIPMRHTTSDNEDSGAASGWSISNSSLSSENSGAWTAETASAFIAIKGSPLPTTYVANTGQTASGFNVTVGGSINRRISQAFTTGTRAGGYALHEVDVGLAATSGGTIDPTKIGMRIYTTDASGNPDSSLYAFTNPSSFTADAANTFTAPANATLDANTTYAVVLVSTSNTYRIPIRHSNSSGEDSGAASGWSIADSALSSRNDQAWQSESTVTFIDIQGSEKFASNTGQTALGGSLVVGPSGGNQWRSAQLFTTGSNAAGYTLSAVDLRLAATTGGGTDATKIKVSIHTTSSGNPETSLYDLTNPSSFANDAVNTFAAPANAALDAGTTYAVVVESTSTSLRASLRHTNSDADDSGAASGWSIANTRLGSTDGVAWSSSDSTLMIGIKGSSWTGPVVRIAAGSAVTEGGNATFTVRASPVPAADLTVSLAISQTGNSVAPGNRGTKTVTVPTTGSVIHSVPTVNAGSVTAMLASGTGYTRHATTSNRSASVTVRDSGVIPPPPDQPGTNPGQPGTGGTEPVKKTAPGAPRNLRAVSGDGQAVLSWNPPEDNGGAPITDYEYRIDSKGDWISIGSTETSYTVSGLENGAEYLFQVRAVNEIGAGRASRRVEATAGAVLDFPHFANGEGITSEVVLVNVGAMPVRPVLYFSDQQGEPIAADSVVDVTGDLMVAEDGSLTLHTVMEPWGELTIATHGRGELVSGSLRVASGVPIGGMLRFAHPALGAAGVGAGLPVSDAIVPVRRQEGGINTGIALHNLESSSSLLRCKLLQAGVLRDSVSIPLGPNGQTSWSIDQAFPATDTTDFAGSVRCTAVGAGRFNAIALEMDSGTRIFTTLPVVEQELNDGSRGK